MTRMAADAVETMERDGTDGTKGTGSTSVPPGARKYLLTAAAMLALALAALATFNVFVDPYLAYRLVPTPGLDRYKNTGMTSRTKSEALRRGDWQAILLGSSRVEVALDVHHPALGGLRTYNLGLSDTTLPELAAALRYALDTNDLSLVVLLADFELFGEARRLGPAFARSRFNPAYGVVEYVASNLVGMQATEHSIDTLRRHRADQPAFHDPSGRMFFPMKPPGVSEWTLFARALDWRSQRPPFRYRPQLEHVLEAMMADCLERNVRLVVATPPMHALTLELYDRQGAWEAVERWKRDVVTVAERQNRTHSSAQPIGTWDFASFASYNVEPVPPPSDSDSEMHWHWEATHFRKELGDIVLERMLGDSRDEPGARLSVSGLEPHLAAVRAARDRWLATRPPGLSLLASVVSR